MKKYLEYYMKLLEVEKQIMENETQTIETVAMLMAQTMKNGNKIYLFGCGHSHMIEEEAFYRAGGLVNVNPMNIYQL